MGSGNLERHPEFLRERHGLALRRHAVHCSGERFRRVDPFLNQQVGGGHHPHEAVLGNLLVKALRQLAGAEFGAGLRQFGREQAVEHVAGGLDARRHVVGFRFGRRLFHGLRLCSTWNFRLCGTFLRGVRVHEIRFADIRRFPAVGGFGIGPARRLDARHVVDHVENLADRRGQTDDPHLIAAAVLQPLVVAIDKVIVGRDEQRPVTRRFLRLLDLGAGKFRLGGFERVGLHGFIAVIDAAGAHELEHGRAVAGSNLRHVGARDAQRSAFGREVLPFGADRTGQFFPLWL